MSFKELREEDCGKDDDPDAEDGRERRCSEGGSGEIAVVVDEATAASAAELEVGWEHDDCSVRGV